MLIGKGASLPFQMRIITVQGQGNVSRSPDQIRIEMTLRQKNPDFAEAIAKCNQRVAQIKAAAATAGVNEGELKTGSFGVEVGSEWDQSRQRHVETGFVANQCIFVVLPWEKTSVGKFLSDMIGSGAQPSISLRFLVSDAEGLRQEVLASSVENAKRRAEVIASSAGVKLGPIQHINNGYSEIRIMSEPSDVVCSRSLDSPSPDITPGDIESYDTVTVTWLIED